jgi:hypothetical protein
MKRLLLASVTLLSISCFAQEQPKSKTTQPPIVQVFQGYIITVISNAEGRYGYDIMQQGKTIVSQRLNPFNLSPKGLSSKEDAFKVAQWQIQQLNAGAPSIIIVNQPLSAAVARHLNITLD